MKKISLGGVALVCAFCSLYAQDPRERNYFYEILDPKHEPKPVRICGNSQVVSIFSVICDRGAECSPFQTEKSPKDRSSVI